MSVPQVRWIHRSVVLASTLALCAYTLPSLAAGMPQESTKGDLHAAGQDTKHAAVDTGHASKRVAHKTAHGTKVAARKTKNGTERAGHDVAHGTSVAAHDTSHETRKLGDKITGKPAPPI